MDYETRLAVLDLFLLEYRCLRDDLIPTYALFKQGLANRFFTVDPANTRRGHGERQPLNDKNKTDPENLGESPDPVYQSLDPWNHSANFFVVLGDSKPRDITRIDSNKYLAIWVSPKLFFSLHHKKSAQKALSFLRMIRRTFCRVTRMNFHIVYGAHVRPLLEYSNQVVYSEHKKDVTPQRDAAKIVAGLKSVDYETRIVVLRLFPM
ncbi:hypothetical protein CLF_104862 [Clonorchis sinensis]|uniref:Uncharacterized protein n=1 Tax=Clonorchis sinensis TaxID=79923 RepID=H2KTM4_CLOSI|nr:hypothetical protein CLF_104862 [Clonorchis sinensis]